MRQTYAAGLVRHLLERSGNPQIVKVETFAEVGAVGDQWTPTGLKVTLVDGSAVFLSFVGTWVPGEDLSIQPDVFDPADLTEAAARG